jgi:DNA-binding NtrC family response regulator
MKPSILILDDEAAVRTSFSFYLARKGFAVAEAGTLAEARQAMMSQSVDGLLLDVNLPDGNGLDWIREVREARPGTAIVVMTGIGDIPMAVQAMRDGADHFITKPVNMADLEVFLRRSLELGGLRRDRRAVQRLARKASPFFGACPAARSLEQQARLALQHDAPVLLQGETGTGKGVLARFIHEHGARDGMPFVEISCAGLPRDLLASELFGHTRGAFTSAVAEKEGLLDVADGGTLFLDEIGELDAPMQSQFLTVLEGKRYRRLGETRERRSEFRLICATSRVLTDEVASGRFRPDLYYRINVLPITVPPLRDRAGDMAGLVGHLLGALGVGEADVAPDVLAFLQAYPWPGNVRELSHALERALMLAGGGRLERSHFAWLESIPRPRPAAAPPDERDLARFEQVVRDHGGDVESAARALGLSRATLYRRLKVARDRPRILSWTGATDPNRRPTDS